jgi:hypothetical protein
MVFGLLEFPSTGLMLDSFFGAPLFFLSANSLLHQTIAIVLVFPLAIFGYESNSARDLNWTIIRRPDLIVLGRGMIKFVRNGKHSTFQNISESIEYLKALQKYWICLNDDFR